MSPTTSESPHNSLNEPLQKGHRILELGLISLKFDTLDGTAAHKIFHKLISIDNIIAPTRKKKFTLLTFLIWTCPPKTIRTQVSSRFYSTFFENIKI